jgi:hypothetical protein
VPDRDFISTHVRAPWRSAARLWVREGPSDLAIDKFRATLAKALREGGLAVERARLEAERAGGDMTREGMERLVEHLLIHQAVLAPVRGKRLAALDAAQVESQERALLNALAPDLDRYAAAVVGGRRPTVRRRPRPDARRILETPVSVNLS